LKCFFLKIQSFGHFFLSSLKIILLNTHPSFKNQFFGPVPKSPTPMGSLNVKNLSGPGSETLLFSLQICRFAICGLAHLRNLLACDCEMSPRICEFAIFGLAHLRNLRTCDCGMSPRICGFAICGLTTKNCVPTFGFVCHQLPNGHVHVE
jgi:hypothetical protein